MKTNNLYSIKTDNLYKGSAKVIEALNKIISNELSAVNHYLLSSHLLQHWGINKLAAKIRAEVDDEFSHVEQLIKRVIFLGGAPILETQKTIPAASNLIEFIESSLELEKNAITCLQEAASKADEAGDLVTLTLLESILQGEEEHVEWFRVIQNIIAQVGLAPYIQTQL